ISPEALLTHNASAHTPFLASLERSVSDLIPSHDRERVERFLEAAGDVRRVTHYLGDLFYAGQKAYLLRTMAVVYEKAKLSGKIDMGELLEAISTVLEGNLHTETQELMASIAERLATLPMYAARSSQILEVAARTQREFVFIGRLWPFRRCRSR